VLTRRGDGGRQGAAIATPAEIRANSAVIDAVFGHWTGGEDTM